MSIRKKITLALLLVTLVPLIAFAVSIVTINSAQLERIGSVAQWQAQAALEASARDMQRAVAEVKAWASTQGIAEAARRAQQESRAELEARWNNNNYVYSTEARRLKQLQSLSGGRYPEIFFTDARGYVVASTNPTSDFGQGPEDDPPAGEPWWAEASADGLRVGELSFDESAGIYSIDISVALTDDEGFVGVLKAVYSVESILDIVGQANIGRAGHTVLVDETGLVLAAPRRFRSVVFDEKASLANTRAMVNSRSGQSGYGFDDIPWIGEALVAYAPGRLQDAEYLEDWVVMLIVPVEAALISARQVQTLGLWALAIVVLVVLATGVILARRMSRPLMEISDAVSQVQAGNFSVKVPAGSGSDEISQLGQAINAMTDRLAEYDALNIDKIQSLNLELETANRELQLLATRDSLTGLSNVRVFREQLDLELKRALRNGSELSLLLLDIDYFKKVNDTYGHQAGDAVLRTVGGLLLDGVRSTDFAARYGGEEMAILLPDTGEKDALKLAEKLRKLIMIEEFDIGERSIDVTVSIGVASECVTQDTRAEALIRRADEALYNAKGAGRNRVEVV